MSLGVCISSSFLGDRRRAKGTYKGTRHEKGMPRKVSPSSTRRLNPSHVTSPKRKDNIRRQEKHVLLGRRGAGLCVQCVVEVRILYLFLRARILSDLLFWTYLHLSKASSSYRHIAFLCINCLLYDIISCKCVASCLIVTGRLIIAVNGQATEDDTCSCLLPKRLLSYTYSIMRRWKVSALHNNNER